MASICGPVAAYAGNPTRTLGETTMQTQNYVTDRFGNVPYVTVMVDGEIFTFTEDDYKLARDTAAICRCGHCACCTAVQHVRENSK